MCCLVGGRSAQVRRKVTRRSYWTWSSFDLQIRPTATFHSPLASLFGFFFSPSFFLFKPNRLCINSRTWRASTSARLLSLRERCERREDGAGARTISAARIDRWASSVRVTLVKGWSKEGRQLDARVCPSISGSRPSRVHHMRRVRSVRAATATTRRISGGTHR